MNWSRRSTWIGERTRNGARPPRRPGLEALERRDVPALSMDLGATTGLLAIAGSNTNDIVQVDYATTTVTDDQGRTFAQVDPSRIEATLRTDFGYLLTRTYPTYMVRSIVFQGQQGNDLFMNRTTLPATTASWDRGVVGASLSNGVGKPVTSEQSLGLGVFLAGDTGKVEVDYLFCGAGYRGQLGFYSLAGMDALKPGSPEYSKEAARRAMSNTPDQGYTVISVRNETGKFRASTPWEGDLGGGHGEYRGIKSFAMAPGTRFAAILVPNGLLGDVYKNPNATDGSSRPLYSIPEANPYATTTQLLGQMGDLDGKGSVFAFEDLRLDQSSDRDYNDLVFQVIGARGKAAYAPELINAGRNFITTEVGQQLTTYAAGRENADAAADAGFDAGVGRVGGDGLIGVDFLYDGGGLQGELGIFSLQGMDGLTPGSPEFTREAARRALSGTNLGHLLLSDFIEGAKVSQSLPWESNFNLGTYKGLKTVRMTAGDSVGLIFAPAGYLWEVYANPTIGGKKTPLYSMAEANPANVVGSDYLAKYDANGTVVGFEDLKPVDRTDRDFNDVIVKFTGVSFAAPGLAAVIAPARNTLQTTLAPKLLG